MATSVRLLVGCVALVFLGRGYGYLFWGSPLRVLLADEGIMTPVLRGLFGMGWNSYANNLTLSEWTETVQRGIGLLWLTTGVLVLIDSLLPARRSWRHLVTACVALSWPPLFLHALLETKDHFFRPVHFCEFAIQLMVPLLYLAWLRGRLTDRWFRSGARLAIALTFAAHGLYALGVYPVPGNFVDMTIIILECSEASARRFLTVVGWLDLAVAVGICFRPLAGPLLLYATGWGLATALARLATGYQLEVADLFHQYAYLTVYRLPHGLLPLVVYFLRPAPASAPDSP